MKKIYCLSTCDSCRLLIKEIEAKKRGFILQDIKSEKINPDQLDELKKKAGSYEALFSRRAIKYKTLGLGRRILSEKEIRNLILQEYTFLKRPVVLLNGKVFIGTEKQTVAALKSCLSETG